MSNAFDLNSLSGLWYNRLGQGVDLTAHSDGNLSGLYKSFVWWNHIDEPLTGRFDAKPPSGCGVSVGWAVAKRDISNSGTYNITTWSGQYFDSGTIGGERITTNWLLAHSTIADNIWKSTNVGNDTFTRTRPSDAEIAEAKALMFGPSHPQQKPASE